MTKSGAERRVHKRYTVMGCTIQYKPDTFFIFFNKTSQKYMVLDISLSGIQFVTREKFNERMRLILNITAPALNKETITVKGHVVWVRPSPALNINGIGVEFIKVKEPERLKLQSLLDTAAANKSEISNNVHLEKV